VYPRKTSCCWREGHYSASYNLSFAGRKPRSSAGGGGDLGSSATRDADYLQNISLKMQPDRVLQCVSLAFSVVGTRFKMHSLSSRTHSNRGKSSLICKEGCRFSMVHEGALLPTLLCSLQRYYPNITIICDCRICMFAVLWRFTLSFVYKVYIGFLSRMRDWTVAVAQ
jgi:hypothetical protein